VRVVPPLGVVSVSCFEVYFSRRLGPDGRAPLFIRSISAVRSAHDIGALLNGFALSPLTAGAAPLPRANTAPAAPGEDVEALIAAAIARQRAGAQ
jgi:hypothetical protein